MADNVAPIIIIKKIKKAAHAHHGGAWKVAYADFVTAMMAFFLLLWLLNATTEEQRKGIADYFSPSVASDRNSGAGGLLGGISVSRPGARAIPSSVPSVSVVLRPTSGATDGDGDGDGGVADEGKKSQLSEKELREQLAKRENERFAKAEAELRQAIQEAPELRVLERNVVVDQTPEGLRIQIVDREGQPLFPLGGAAMYQRTRKLVAKISEVIQSLPNRISVSGHTDAKPYSGNRRGFGNWELSTVRALATRRGLVESGLPMNRIATVIGKADTEPLIPEDPLSARNRRISIVLLRLSPEAAEREFRRDWTGPRLR